ncbi:hypothetical protein [Calothrix sp. UHCC 0171]|uniref:hypothetical protein n=1 Tax=Calothrix sp. UHCC 0171 TaxID=3110245 RepID=UPI002B2063D6|nr:hypothetical protein [Calothrix sp. UHCC 0171]MEA5572843.1 hypothetical protein [Calothrix sp. UHCC 0171]
MNLIDGLFLTAANAIVCIVFPKLLHTILVAKRQQREVVLATAKSTQANPEITSEVPSYPY